MEWQPKMTASQAIGLVMALVMAWQAQMTHGTWFAAGFLLSYALGWCKGAEFVSPSSAAKKGPRP